jgi:ankyrin repeat protein
MAAAAAFALPPRASALIDAAGRGDLPALRSARDAEGRKAALASAQVGRQAAAVRPIERGADVNTKDRIQDSVFLLAGARGLTEIVRAARPQADPKVLNRYGGTALIPACLYDRVETLRALLEWKGANRVGANHVNRLGWTALPEAVILGDGGPVHTEIARLLPAHGADHRIADRGGVTPLDHARRHGQAANLRLMQ